MRGASVDQPEFGREHTPCVRLSCWPRSRFCRSRTDPADGFGIFRFGSAPSRGAERRPNPEMRPSRSILVTRAKLAARLAARTSISVWSNSDRPSASPESWPEAVFRNSGGRRGVLQGCRALLPGCIVVQVLCVCVCQSCGCFARLYDAEVSCARRACVVPSGAAPERTISARALARCLLARRMLVACARTCRPTPRWMQQGSGQRMHRGLPAVVGPRTTSTKPLECPCPCVGPGPHLCVCVCVAAA